MILMWFKPTYSVITRRRGSVMLDSRDSRCNNLRHGTFRLCICCKRSVVFQTGNEMVVGGLGMVELQSIQWMTLRETRDAGIWNTWDRTKHCVSAVRLSMDLIISYVSLDQRAAAGVEWWGMKYQWGSSPDIRHAITTSWMDIRDDSNT